MNGFEHVYQRARLSPGGDRVSNNHRRWRIIGPGDELVADGQAESRLCMRCEKPAEYILERTDGAYRFCKPCYVWRYEWGRE